MTTGWIKPKHSEASQDDSPHRATDGYYDVIFVYSTAAWDQHWEARRNASKLLGQFLLLILSCSMGIWLLVLQLEGKRL
jgi:hypothetical protein